MSHPRTLRLAAIAGGARSAATDRVNDAFSEAGVWITDVHFFSGLQTVFCFEASPARLPSLQGALQRAGISLDEASLAAVAAASPDESGLALAAASPEADEVPGTLAVTFVQGDPDLRHEVPSVPG